jgi:hypothetical protein
MAHKPFLFGIDNSQSVIRDNHCLNLDSGEPASAGIDIRAEFALGRTTPFHPVFVAGMNSGIQESLCCMIECGDVTSCYPKPILEPWHDIECGQAFLCGIMKMHPVN